MAAPSVAHSVYDGRNLADALAKFGDWSSEIVKRAAGAIGFLTPATPMGCRMDPCWLNRNRRLAKDFEA